MSTANVKGSPRQVIASFTSTLGVGSSYTSDSIDVSQFKSFVGITSVDSSNVVMRFRQGVSSGTFVVSSTTAAVAGETLLDWTAYGQYAEVAISAVNSTQGEVLSMFVYGVPI